MTIVHRKSTYSGVYTHFDSFLPPVYKVGTMYTLARFKGGVNSRLFLNSDVLKFIPIEQNFIKNLIS